MQKFVEQHPGLNLNICLSLESPSHFEPPLHLACGLAAPEDILCCLLDAGSDPKAPCQLGCNALQCLAMTGRVDGSIVKTLTKKYTDEEQKKFYINATTQDKDMGATHLLAERKDLVVADQISGYDALDGEGADWSLKDKNGRTPFEIAALQGNSTITALLALKEWESSKGGRRMEELKGLCNWTDAGSQNVNNPSTHYECSADC